MKSLKKIISLLAVVCILSTSIFSLSSITASATTLPDIRLHSSEFVIKAARGLYTRNIYIKVRDTEKYGKTYVHYETAPGKAWADVSVTTRTSRQRKPTEPTATTTMYLLSSETSAMRRKLSAYIPRITSRPRRPSTSTTRSLSTVLPMAARWSVGPAESPASRTPTTSSSISPTRRLLTVRPILTTTSTRTTTTTTRSSTSPTNHRYDC